MSERGYIAVQRSVWDHPLFPDEPMSKREAWLWLLNEAAWRECRVKTANGPVTLQRGQLTFSLRFMAQKFKWSINKVRRFLECLQNEYMVGLEIGTDANTAQSVITICNYNKYQNGSAQTDTATETQADTASDTPTDTKKKNIINKQYTADDTREKKPASDIGDLSARLCEAIGVTDETKQIGLLQISEPLRWLNADCDLEHDILPTLKAVSARMQRTPRSWAYFNDAVFEARDRRLAPPPDVQPRQNAPSRPMTDLERIMQAARERGYGSNGQTSRTYSDDYGDVPALPSRKEHIG